MQLIECVPNFSEGRDPEIIRQIAAEIESVKNVWLLNIDPGKAANRTVFTFIGEPAQVVEAAFLAIKKAGELIDMSRQTGEHPRMGATDVCPLIPISGISMAETVYYANELARRVGHDLKIPVYLYEYSQKDKTRDNLSIIRSGEYEGFFKKIKLPQWQPDYGPTEMDIKRGATVIGARNFLVAYNINLNTSSVKDANTIAKAVRESGYKQIDEAGNTKHTPGMLKFVKAIGWYIEEYGAAQVSMNLTDINVTPVHRVFEVVSTQANAIGLEVTGSELIGLIPLNALLEAGRYFIAKQQSSAEATEHQLIAAAITALGLDELAPFNPEERIIEYVLKHKMA